MTADELLDRARVYSVDPSMATVIAIEQVRALRELVEAVEALRQEVSVLDLGNRTSFDTD